MNLPVHEPNVARLLQAAVARGGDRPFVRSGDDERTFAQVGERVRRVANELLRRGVERGERVVVLLPRGVDEAVVLLAVLSVGAVAVPLHARLKDDQVRHVLCDCEPRFVVTNELRLLALRDVDAVVRGFDVLRVERDLDEHGERPVVDVGVELSPDDTAVLLYTSGSTGPAKGIVQTHGNLCLGAAIVADYVELDERDHLLALLSFSFDYGLNQLLGALHVGCRITTAEHLGIGELAKLLRRLQPTGLAGVPSLWNECAQGLESGALAADDGRSLRFVTNSGGALRAPDSAVLRRSWPHVRIFAMYGLTEAFRSAFLPPEELDAAPTSFGRAIAGVELLLVKPGTDEVLHGEATGELVHAGALVARGYWRRPDEEALRFRPDPRGGDGVVVYSGDLVRRDAAGRHYFVSRLDRMLKVFGHRVSPDEVAHAVLGMPGVAQVVVLGLDGGADGHRIALVFVGDPDDDELLDAVRRRCRSRLPSYMMPQVFQAMRALPHNPNGKVDEAALRRTLQPGPCTDDT